MGDITLRNVCKQYKEKAVLNNFSHTFAEGSRTAVMGVSGSGKTTLLRLIMGLERADSGDVEGISDELFGCVFQEDRLIEHMNAVDNIALIFREKIPRSAMVGELAAVGLGTDIGDELTKPVSEFSGGMKRRVAIVRAMMSDCGTVILDEPFKGLDENLKRKVMGYIDDRLGVRRLILVTHDREEAETLCESVVEIQ